MWPLPSLTNEYIALVMNPTSLTCGWITDSKKQIPTLKAYTTYDCTTITTTQALAQFIQTHGLNYSRIGIAINTEHIHEQLVRLSQASPQPHTFISEKLKAMIWDYRYLFALDDGQHLFYLCALPRSFLFSKQLLAATMNLQLTTLTSGYMALINTYRTLFGSAFRNSTLALDMLGFNYKLEDSIKTESLLRLMHISPSLSLDLVHEKLPLVTMIGLYYQERECNE